MTNFACAQLRYRGTEFAPGLPRIAANLEYLDAFWTSRDLDTKDVGLLAVGEFWLPSPAGSAEYAASAVEAGGEFLYLLGQFCRSHDCYLMTNIVERVADALFDSTIVVDPGGQLALVYREIASGLMPESPLITPVGSDVGSVGVVAGGGLGRWIPTVDTDLGRLGSVVGSDLLYPEIALGLTMAEVDVVLHPCKEPPRTEGPWQCLKAARAIEGGYAIVSCNVANSPDHTDSEWSHARGRSRILDAHGLDLASSATDEEDLIMAEIDIEAVREQRSAARFHRRRTREWAEQCGLMLEGARVTNLTREGTGDH